MLLWNTGKTFFFVFVVVTYLLKADHMIVDTQSSLTYDSKVLKLASTTTSNVNVQ